jgi:uncharacterized protein YdaU (DUF1376 family)
MGKDPAFLFYPGDWNLGTMHMTLLEKGAYIELLMLQFARNKFTLAQAKHMLNDNFDLVWPNLSDKFTSDGEFYWNERLMEEKDKRSKFSESRRNNALTTKKTEKHMPKHMPKHMHKHMENENENKNVNNKRSKTNFIPPTIDEVKNYFSLNGYDEKAAINAFNYYDVSGWVDSKGNKVINWKQKMISVWFKNENKIVDKRESVKMNYNKL